MRGCMRRQRRIAKQGRLRNPGPSSPFLNFFSQDAQCKRLCLCHCIRAARTIREDARKFRNFGYPTPVVFALRLDSKFQVTVVHRRISSAGSGSWCRSPRTAMTELSMLNLT